MTNTCHKIMIHTNCAFGCTRGEVLVILYVAIFAQSVCV